MNRADTQGFTLVELMIAAALLLVITGIVFTVLISFTASARVQDTSITTQDDARQAMLAMVRELRQADADSIEAVGGSFPANTIRYRIVQDMDGNGVPLDAKGRVEWSRSRTLGPDFSDANRDSLRQTQLVRREQGVQRIKVLASSLAANEGITFEQVGAGIRITLRCERSAGAPNGTRDVQTVLTETVEPRN